MREESRGTVQILSLYRDRNSSPQHSQREITRLRQERDIRSWHTGARWDTLMQWRCRTTCIRMRSTIENEDDAHMSCIVSDLRPVCFLSLSDNLPAVESISKANGTDWKRRSSGGA